MNIEISEHLNIEQLIFPFKITFLDVEKNKWKIISEKNYKILFCKDTDFTSSVVTHERPADEVIFIHKKSTGCFYNIIENRIYLVFSPGFPNGPECWADLTIRDKFYLKDCQSLPKGGSIILEACTNKDINTYQIRDKIEKQEIKEKQYISLGGWCGISMALEKMGSRKDSLPFDYIRCKLKYVIKVLENKIIDLEYDKLVKKENYRYDTFRADDVSVWHHNVLDDEVQKTFRRRFVRLHDYVRSKRNIFIRILHHIDELYLIDLLISTLNDACLHEYLLIIIIDQQEEYSIHKYKNVYIIKLNNNDVDFYKLCDGYKKVISDVVTKNFNTSVNECQDLQTIKCNDLEKIYRFNHFPIFLNDEYK